jgi:hypothetical protein
MPEDAEFDPTDQGTLRPKVRPLTKKRDHFEPIEIPDFEFDICLLEHVSPDNPIIIFSLYYNPEIISTIFSSTNSYSREPKDSSKLDTRAIK